jgi:cellulose synthase/poly-beta-1,6-N-acetylglucosamine synthase-like glycosyltransferase
VLAFSVLIVVACLLVLWAGWLWYPSRMARRGLSAPPIRAVAPSNAPPVSIILATRESDEAISARIANLRTQAYPQDRVDVIVALDLSRAGDRATVQAALGQRARVVAAAGPGKSSALNAGVAAARADLLLFVDTAQTFAPDVLRHLTAVLADPQWGAVTATLSATSGDALMDRYWQRELAIRIGQTDRHSVICVTGCAYLMRRSLWRDMPASLICDDLWSTYSVLTSGSRVAITKQALVTDPRRFGREQEFDRRLRTMTGMLQFILWFPDVLRPTRNPMFADFLLHKLVRPATPVLLIVATLAILAIVALWSPPVAGALAALAVLIALLPLLLSRLATGRLARRARTVVFAQRLLLMPLRAIAQAARGDWDVWKPHP